MTARTIDLNCDMGEGFGRWRLGDDEAVLPLVSSASIACGFHAGDPLTMLATVRGAHRHGVAIGAHPGLPDKLGFGRRNMALSPEEVHAYVVNQIGALSGAVAAVGGEMRHVKLHGAFTVNVEDSEEHAAAAAEAIVSCAPQPRVLWRSSPVPDTFSAELRRRGVEVVLELYPDLVYTGDGYVAPPRDGRFSTPDDALAQVRRAIEDGEALTTAGTEIPLEFESICVHGDSPEAPAFLERLRALLDELGCEVRAPGRG